MSTAQPGAGSAPPRSAGRPLAPAPAGSGLRSVPGNGGLPVVGYTLRMMRDPIGFSMARRARYGPVSWLNAFGTRMVSFSHPDAVDEVLRNPHKAFAS
ncbi:MAG: hypothetical protein ACRDT1_14255, partial [Micromonosporaceae bacterium]